MAAAVPPIIVASDLAPRSDRVLDRALLMAEAMGCGVRLVHVAGDPALPAEESLDRLRFMARQDLGERAGRVELRFEAGSVPATLARIADEGDAPLVVTGTARFNSPVDFVLGTAVDYLVRRSPVPVLVVRRRPSGPYRRLLVMTDFSNCAHTALEAANDFFPDAEIELLHVCGPAFESRLDPRETARHAREEAENEMADFLAEIEQSLRERVTARIEEGQIEKVVDDRFLEGRFDLLVLGTHGRGPVAHATIGSRASSLLSAALSDVLIVREH